MKKAYDYRAAEKLIPLLKNIQREIRERTEAIKRVYVQIKALPAGRRSMEAALRADVANHKREIRLAKKEITRLGCAVDEQAPHRVLIPGRDGTHDSGFAWELGDSSVQGTVPGSAETS